MNILQVVDLQHKYLKGEITWQELPSSDQVEKAKAEYKLMVEELKHYADYEWPTDPDQIAALVKAASELELVRSKKDGE